jgi:hypothetical protein
VLSQQLRIARRKKGELRPRLRELSVTTDRRPEEHTHETAVLRQANEELIRNATEASDNVPALRRDLATARQERAPADSAASDAEAAHAREDQNVLERFRAERAAVEAQLSEHIAKLNVEIATAAETIADADVLNRLINSPLLNRPRLRKKHLFGLMKARK